MPGEELCYPYRYSDLRGEQYPAYPQSFIVNFSTTMYLILTFPLFLFLVFVESLFIADTYSLFFTFFSFHSLLQRLVLRQFPV